MQQTNITDDNQGNRTEEKHQQGQLQNVQHNMQQNVQQSDSSCTEHPQDARSFKEQPRDGLPAHGMWRNLVLLLVGLVVASLCFELIPGDALTGSAVQALVLAVIAVILVALSDLRVLGVFRRSERSLRLWPWVVYLLLLGLVSGIASLMVVACTGGASGSGWNNLSTFILRLLLVFVACLLTGVFEEGVFRAIAIDFFVMAFGCNAKGFRIAVIASALLFGIAHISTADISFAADSANIVMWCQIILKPVQAFLFGMVMATLFVRTRNLWIIAGIHGLFDLFMMGPTLMLTGVPQATYATGLVPDLIVLIAVTLLLIPGAILAFKRIWSPLNDA